MSHFAAHAHLFLSAITKKKKKHEINKKNFGCAKVYLFK